MQKLLDPFIENVNNVTFGTVNLPLYNCHHDQTALKRPYTHILHTGNHNHLKHINVILLELCFVLDECLKPLQNWSPSHADHFLDLQG